MKGWVQGLSIGKLNLSFCFGVQSAWQRMVALDLGIQVEASGVASMVRGCLGEAVRQWRQRSDKMSAAWSVHGVRVCRGKKREKTRLNGHEKTPLQPYCSLCWKH